MMLRKHRGPQILGRIVLFCIMALTAFPFLWLFVLSFKTDTEILTIERKETDESVGTDD